MPIHLARDLFARIDTFAQYTGSNHTTETIDCVQRDTDEGQVVSDDDRGRTYYQLIIICACISFILLFSVGMLILSDKRIRGHPNNIIALILMADAYTYFQFLTRYIVCGYEMNEMLDQLFASTVQYPLQMCFFRFTGLQVGHKPWDEMLEFYNENKYFENTIQVRLASWYLTTVCAVYISLFLQSATILDLYLVLKNPFASSEKRIQMFIIVSIGLAVVLSSIGLGLTLGHNEFVGQLNDYIYLGVAVSNTAFSLVCMIFVVSRFQRKGISQSIQTRIRQRYMEFVILFAVFEIWIVWFDRPNFIYNSNQSQYQGGTVYIERWYMPIVQLFGAIIALSRLRDTLLRYKVRHIFLGLTCQSHKKKDFHYLQQLADKSQINAFLKTSLNTELVFTILKGIQVLAASTSDNIGQLELNDLYQIEQEQTITLKRVKIINAKHFALDNDGKLIQKDEKVCKSNQKKPSRKTQILETESDYEQEEDNLTMEIDNQATSTISASDQNEVLLTPTSAVHDQSGSPLSMSRQATLGFSKSDRYNTAQLKFKKNSSIELPGARITAYRTGICTRMRLLDKINWERIRDSLDPRENRDQIFKTGEAAGASGSFFFFSHDKRFIVKTVTKEELDVILEVIPYMHDHFVKNPQSIISRVYGVYTVKMKSYQPVHLILQQNTLRFDSQKDVARIYDLKGSSQGRLVKNGRMTSTTTLKDNNFLMNQQLFSEIDLSKEDCLRINRVIERDSDFLASMNIMDYSVLLGIESKLQIFTEEFSQIVSNAGRQNSLRRSTNEFERIKRHKLQSPDNMQTYHVSIIDIFQKWNMSKKAEQFAKCKIQRRCSPSKLSSVEPIFYKQRFQKFMRMQVFIQTLKVSSAYKKDPNFRRLLEDSSALQISQKPKKRPKSAVIEEVKEEKTMFETIKNFFTASISLSTFQDVKGKEEKEDIAKGQQRAESHPDGLAVPLEHPLINTSSVGTPVRSNLAESLIENHDFFSEPNK